MASITRSGARLHNESMVIRRGLAQMTEEDYPIRRCQLCGARIALTSKRRYCRNNGCVQIANSSTFRAFIQKVRDAAGEWVDLDLGSLTAVRNFVANHDGRDHVQVVQKSNHVISARWVSA